MHRLGSRCLRLRLCFRHSRLLFRCRGSSSLLARSNIPHSARLSSGGLTTIRYTPRGAALGLDPDILARILAPRAAQVQAGISLLEIELLEVQHGLLAIGDILGEEIVEVVVDAGIPHTATEGYST